MVDFDWCFAGLAWSEDYPARAQHFPLSGSLLEGVALFMFAAADRPISVSHTIYLSLTRFF